MDKKIDYFETLNTMPRANILGKGPTFNTLD
jgi:hypothetical protein